MKLGHYPRRLILKSLVFKNVRYSNSSINEELKRLLYKNANTKSVIHSKRLSVTLVNPNEAHKHYIKPKDIDNITRLRRALKKFPLEQLKTMEAVNEFFSQVELKDYINSLKPEELEKEVYFVKQMIMMKAEEQSDQLKYMTHELHPKHTINNREGAITELERPNNSFIEHKKVTDYVTLKQKNIKREYINRYHYSRRSEGYKPTYKFPIHRSKKITLRKLDFIIKDCKSLHEKYNKTGHKLVQIRNLLCKNIVGIINSLERQRGERMAKLGMNQVMSESKNRRCFIYGKRGRGKFLSTSLA